MRIVEFYAENYKRLRLVAFKPTKRVTVFTGKNDQGKTSAVDAAWYALGGAMDQPDLPMRKGASRMEVKLDLGTLIVQRTATKLTVTPAPGEKAWDTPQAMLDSLWDKRAANPERFARMKPLEQVDMLRKLLALDFSADDEASAKDYTARTALNAEVKRLAAEAASIPTQAGLPKDKLDEQGILERIEQANTHNKNIGALIEEKARLRTLLELALQNVKAQTAFIEKNRSDSEALETEIDRYSRALEWANATVSKLSDLIPADEEMVRWPPTANIMAEIHRARETAWKWAQEEKAKNRDRAQTLERMGQDGTLAKTKLAELKNDAKLATTAWEQAPAGEMMDTSALMAELQQAQLTNREIDKRTRLEELEKRQKEQQAASAKLTRAMDAREEKKQTAIAKAKLPIEGLAFNDNQVLFDGIPIEQLGEARRILIGVSIAMAFDHKLRLVLIPHGEALDEASMEELQHMADEKDFYVLMAKVDSSGKIGIFLEDGMIAAEND